MWQSDAVAYCNAMREIAESQQIQVLVDAAQRVSNARFECNGDLNQQIMFNALDALLEGLKQSPIWCVELRVRAMTEDLTE